MRKNNIGIKTALAVFVVALSACSSDNDVVDNNPNNQEKPVTGKVMTFHASMDDDNSTRTNFNSNSTVWASGDAISILNKATVTDEPDRPASAEFGIASGVDSKEADFTGGPIKANGNDEDDFYAFYPSSSFDSDNEKMVGNIPTVQTATADTYDQTLHFMTAHSTNSNFNFKNVCALLKITLSSSDICRVKVVANPTISDMQGNEFTYTSIAGVFEATVNTDGIATTTSTEAKKTYVELRAADDEENDDEGEATTAISPGTYYMVVLPATISNGFTLILENTNGTIYQRVNSNITSFARNKMYNLGTYDTSSMPSGMTALTDVVDLDLPSGTIWCKKNVTSTGSGSSTRVNGFESSESGDGAYFSWGKTHVTSGLGLLYTLPALDDSNKTLKSSADAVYSFNAQYCIPIYAQIYELYNYLTDRTIETNNSRKCAKFTSSTGRNILLPYAGYYYDYLPHSKNSQARYWSRTYTGRTWEGTIEYYAYCLDLKITNNVPEVDLHDGLLGAGSWNDKGETGRPIRPVVTNEQIAPVY